MKDQYKELMHGIFHLNSAEELNTDFIDSIKAAYKNKSIEILVRESSENLYTDEVLSDAFKYLIDQRLLQEDNEEWISTEKSLMEIRERYGIPLNQD